MKTERQPTPYDAIDAYVEKERRRLAMPGVSLAIVEGDRVVHLRGFGRARPGGAAPCPTTPFFIGSLTKSFTALAVMQLVEAGNVELDAPAQHYLPWFRVADPIASTRITVRHLLNQTSGLPTSAGEVILADDDSRPEATERQARALSTHKLIHAPGAAWEYSNSNYQLLGLIIEAASGERYADYIQRHIFTPLGMCHSFAPPAAAKQDGLAMGHQYWFGLPVPAPNMRLPHGAAAAGLLASSAEDLARWLIAHLNGGRYGEAQLLSRAGIEELHRGAVTFKAFGLPMQYAMGWFADMNGPTPLTWHSGTLPDFGAYMALLPDQKKGIVLLFNACHHWMNPILIDVGMGATALLAGQQPAPIWFVRLFPWLLRGQALIPALQLAGAAATVRQLVRWRRAPERRPSARRLWGRHVLFPLISSLLPALGLRPVLSKRRRYLKWYMPDYSLIAWVCGSFALLWSVARTALVLRASINAGPPRSRFGLLTAERRG
jgi:CubicO group peptidase (beta-lactamase class C family)